MNLWRDVSGINGVFDDVLSGMVPLFSQDNIV